MGNRLVRDLKDARDTIPIFRWQDVKREPSDAVIFSHLELMLTDVAQHIEAVESYLENGKLAGGKSFIRPQERPAVGDEALGRELQTFEHRLQRIERSLGDKLQAQTP